MFNSKLLMEKNDSTNDRDQIELKKFVQREILMFQRVEFVITSPADASDVKGYG